MVPGLRPHHVLLSSLRADRVRGADQASRSGGRAAAGRLTPTLRGANIWIMSDPIRHHYLAIFYLNRWAGGDGLVCRFSRPFGEKVVFKRVSPKGTAFEEHLYSMHSASGLPVPDMERDFMARLDSEAADALTQLDVGLPDSKWDTRLRSAWSRFVWAQSIRTPSEIAQLKSSVKEEWCKARPELQERYSERRPSNAPENVDDYYASIDPYQEDRFALSIACQSMDHSGIIEILNNMHWKVIDFSECGIQLLTSDRPVWMTASLLEADAFIMMPIGPSRLFVAAREATTVQRILAHNRRQQAKEINKISAMHAVEFVFGADETARKLIEKHLATRRHATHMERLAAMRGLTILADNSPLKAGQPDE